MSVSKSARAASASGFGLILRILSLILFESYRGYANRSFENVI
jgi:hypothetical protein